MLKLTPLRGGPAKPTNIAATAVDAGAAGARAAGGGAAGARAAGAGAAGAGAAAAAAPATATATAGPARHRRRSERGKARTSGRQQRRRTKVTRKCVTTRPPGESVAIRKSWGGRVQAERIMSCVRCSMKVLRERRQQRRRRRWEAGPPATARVEGQPAKAGKGPDPLERQLGRALLGVARRQRRVATLMSCVRCSMELLSERLFCVEKIVIINDLDERGVYAYDVESWANATLRADERCELFDGTVLARLEDEARQRRTFAEEEARQRRTVAK
eukprot:scaffold83511_cov36-Phaeocystis_antarctica.AAC.1